MSILCSTVLDQKIELPTNTDERVIGLSVANSYLEIVSAMLILLGIMLSDPIELAVSFTALNENSLDCCALVSTFKYSGAY